MGHELKAQHERRAKPETVAVESKVNVKKVNVKKVNVKKMKQMKAARAARVAQQLMRAEAALVEPRKDLKGTQTKQPMKVSLVDVKGTEQLKTKHAKKSIM